MLSWTPSLLRRIVNQIYSHMGVKVLKRREVAMLGARCILHSASGAGTMG